MSSKLFGLIAFSVCAVLSGDRPLTFNGQSRTLEGWQKSNDPYFKEASVYEWQAENNVFRKMTLQEFLASAAAKNGEFSWNQCSRTHSFGGPSLSVPRIIVNGRCNEREVRKKLAWALAGCAVTDQWGRLTQPPQIIQ